jgi:hypothetical protein
MKLGKAYKLAAVAASHKARAMRRLDQQDHEGAKVAEVAYLGCVESIPSKFRQQMMPFVDACLQVKLAVSAGNPDM